MNTQQDVISALVLILENPDSKKGYVELKRFYDKAGMSEESEAIEYLMNKRFANATTSSNTD